MDTPTLRQLLDDSQASRQWFGALQLADPVAAHADLCRIAEQGVPLDLLQEVCRQLAEELPKLSDPDMALRNLERFFAASRNPLSLGTLFLRDPTGLPTLLQIFSTSQYLSDRLVCDPESYDLLRMTEGSPVAREELVRELLAEVEPLTGEREVMATLRRIKHRETLRIAYGDIVRSQSLETVTRQISYLADALVEAAIRFAGRKVGQSRGTPLSSDGKAARYVVLALGKLGGCELNYSSDIDLVVLYDEDGKTDGPRSVSNSEFYEQMTCEVVKLLGEVTDQGSVYRVDLRLRPHGSQGPLVNSCQAMLHYYDVAGRTWERQAYVKARAIAGNLELGNEFLEQLQPWIYRRYLTLADITGIKSLKRRIEHRADQQGPDQRDIKTGHGGIRDIEFVIQFLQLVNGGTLPEIRTGNTLEAIALLEKNGCLTFQERNILEENYRLLRKLEHRLQLMFDLQTHRLPTSRDEVRKLAVRLGYHGDSHASILEAFEADLASKTENNRKILNFLLHDAFGDEAETEPEVDLINDPDPPAERIHQVLGEYGFENPATAYTTLMDLATEKIPFLSTRRCRHFLASIAPQLLQAISTTPNPDTTLVDLSHVSDSLGGKGVLWQLFSFSSPSLQLYVRLCSACPYLSGILTSNPGMIDELMDSLLLEHLPTLPMLQSSLSDLSRGAEDLDPILHSFKDSQHLRVGVRDILGKDDVRDTHAALSDIAEACLRRIIITEYDKLVEKLGQPTIGAGPRGGQPCELIVLALGKLGGREPNYHSDLDLVFLYEEDGSTSFPRRSTRAAATSNQHFFGELGQRIIKTTSAMGPYGRLYDVDARLRPTGRNGTLAVSLAEFSRYFASGTGQLWERQALCKARVVFGSEEAIQTTEAAVAQAAFSPPWKREYVGEIRNMRARLEDTAGERNLKRGRGGTVDIEFLAQMLQLQHAWKDPSLRIPGTLKSLEALYEAGHLKSADFDQASAGYRHLRKVEARIRLMNSIGRHELPAKPEELEKLAYLLGYGDSDDLVQETQGATRANRALFERLTDALA